MKKSDIVAGIVEILNKKTVKELNDLKNYLTGKEPVNEFPYNGKIQVTNSARVLFANSDTFEDLDELEYKITKCKTVESVIKVLCSFSRYGYSFKYDLSLSNRDVFSFKDGFGNFYKVWVYKCKK